MDDDDDDDDDGNEVKRYRDFSESELGEYISCGTF